jgi:hypothetical protein
VRVEGVAPGTSVKIDGLAVGASAWGSALPFDPGKHTVLAEATGKKPWSSQVDVPAGPSTSDVVVPTLEDAGAAPTAAPAEPPRASTPPPAGLPPPQQPAGNDKGPSSTPGEASGRPTTLGFVLAGVGLVGIGVGTYFGLQTFSKNSTANDNCPKGGCNQTGVDAGKDASTFATISTVAYGVGIVGLAAGAYFLFFAGPPKVTAGTVRATPMVGSSGGGLQFVGSW